MISCLYSLHVNIRTKRPYRPTFLVSRSRIYSISETRLSVVGKNCMHWHCLKIVIHQPSPQPLVRRTSISSTPRSTYLGVGPGFPRNARRALCGRCPTGGTAPQPSQTVKTVLKRLRYMSDRRVKQNGGQTKSSLRTTFFHWDQDNRQDDVKVGARVGVPSNIPTPWTDTSKTALNAQRWSVFPVNRRVSAGVVASSPRGGPARCEERLPPFPCEGTA